MSFVLSNRLRNECRLGGREFLGVLGDAVATWPLAACVQERQMMDTLSKYMADAKARALPAEAELHAKHHLLDTLAAMISGSDLHPGLAAQRYIRGHGAKGAATIAGTSLTATASDAALANGVMAHADETDDFAQRIAIASRLRCHTGGTCSRGRTRHRRHALSSCGGIGLRRRRTHYRGTFWRPRRI